MGLPLEPYYCGLVGKDGKIRKIQWQSVGWNSGSDTANCVFLLTFNSPKHPCFTAPWAIAFLNLSLERQELWSLSIEEKGMLFPCHLLVAPPSSLPWSTVQHPQYLSSSPLCFVVSWRQSHCHWLLRWGRWKNVLGERGVEVGWGGVGRAHIGLEVLPAAARWHVLNAFVQR